jgi:flagellum-specific peptidoglycan hydrolase FlgJ
VISVTPRPDGKFTYVVRDWFRVYPSPAEAFLAHGHFLRDNHRYAPAFQHLDDPFAFARAVAAAGYATDPTYAAVLTQRMQELQASE